MRISKFLAVAFVAVLAAGSLQAQQSDTDLQAKAREALQQAEAQQDAQAAPTNKVVTPKKKKVKAAAPAPTNAPAAPVVATPPPTAIPDTQAQTDAEAERAEHLRQLEAARSKQVTAPAVEIAPASAPVVASGGLSPDAEAKARESMRQAMEQLNAQQVKPAPVAKVEKKHASPPATWDQTPVATKPVPEVDVKVDAKASTPAPVTTPAPSQAVVQPVVTTPAPVATPTAAMISKQQRLADLLSKYKMDQITPQQYFEQKAKILAEP